MHRLPCPSPICINRFNLFLNFLHNQWAYLYDLNWARFHFKFPFRGCIIHAITHRHCQGKICKQKPGKFHFSLSRADMKMGITPLGSHKWALSNAMNVLWFGAFIKNRILVESNRCWIPWVKIISDQIGDYIIWTWTTNGLGLGLGFIDPNSIIQQYPPWHSHSKSIHLTNIQNYKSSNDKPYINKTKGNCQRLPRHPDCAHFQGM